MKKLLTLLLSLTLVLSLFGGLSFNISADGNEAIIEETGVEYATLLQALNAAKTGETVKLLTDVTTPYANQGTYFQTKPLFMTLLLT